jgi:hypothetical protein
MTTNATSYYDADYFLALLNAEFFGAANVVGVPNSKGMIVETRFTATMDTISVMRNMGKWHLKSYPLGPKGIFGYMEDGREVAERTVYVTRIKKYQTAAPEAP